MFETIRLFGSDEVEIPFNTRKNRPVHNAQAPSMLDERLRQKYERLLAAHRLWEPRKPACGVYNCFGHVWANRRTAIYEQPEVDKILQDDGYRPLIEGEQPTRGDVVLYRLHGSLCHVGVVFELRELTGFGEARRVQQPWVLSKWDDSSGEVLHRWNDVPWQDTDVTFQTDRPPHG